MPLLKRIRRMAEANITHWLNQVETPEEEVSAKITELESGAVEAKNALANFAVTYKRLEKEMHHLKASESDLLLRAEEAVLEEHESLARQCLEEKAKVQDRIQKLEPVLESRRQTYNELKDALVEIHDQLNQARAKLMDMKARKRAAHAEQQMVESLNTTQTLGEFSFDRLENDVLESECRAEVERDLHPLEFTTSIQQKSVDRKIESELSALKLKLAKDPA